MSNESTLATVPQQQPPSVSKDEYGEYSWRFNRNGEVYQDHGFISSISAERDARSVLRCLERGVRLGSDYYPISGVDAEVACHVNAEQRP